MIQGVGEERRSKRRRLSEGSGIRVERRSGEERREGERRQQSKKTKAERRSGLERREEERRSGVDRRVILDRRRATPVAYSREEAKDIREMLQDPDTVLRCPRCGGDVASSPVQRRGSQSRVWEIHCVPCHRILIFRDLAQTD